MSSSSGERTAQWLESNGYETYGGTGTLSSNVYGIREYVGAHDGALVIKIPGRAGRVLRVSPDPMESLRDVTWLVDLEQIPEQPRGTPSLRYAHYLKHGRAA